MRDERYGAIDSTAPHLSSRIRRTLRQIDVSFMRDERYGAIESTAPHLSSRISRTLGQIASGHGAASMG